MPLRIIRNFLLQLVDELRTLGPWANETHLAAQHVEYLRQLVEPASAQEMPDTRDPLVVFLRPDRLAEQLPDRQVAPSFVHRDDDLLGVPFQGVLGNRLAVGDHDLTAIANHRVAGRGDAGDDLEASSISAAA